MCDRRKLFIAAILFTALYYKVTGAKVLDMAPDAVDDRYDGCRKEAMEKIINLGLLRNELNSSEGFQKAWRVNTQCSKPIPGGTKEHTKALLTYAQGDAVFQKTFDDAVENMGGNVSTYENHFHFKSLHFLLMDSMSLLNKKQCKTVYFLREDYTAKQGSKVRFGKFIKVQTNYGLLKKMDDFDGQVLFNITSCFVVNLGDAICGEEQDMALLSPAEEFTVEKVTKELDPTNDSEYTVIVLKHSALNSSHNCYIFSRSPADVSSLRLVLVLVAFSIFFFDY